MIRKQDLKKLSAYEWLIPQAFKEGMNGNVHIIASDSILERCFKDRSLIQAVNAAFLPGLVGDVHVMPDVHQGYGFPIGGVAATDFKQGVISPGAIGYDINCGVRLMTSQITMEQIKPFLSDLLHALYSTIPSGLGKGGLRKLTKSKLESILATGTEWAHRNGYASDTDLEYIEDNGSMAGADPAFISKRAKERGLEQVGSLGSGNHFIEISYIEDIFTEKSASLMGLYKGNICLMIHSGSRGLGHQVCSDYVQRFQGIQNKYRISLPDRELVCAPVQSEEGQAYLKAMRCAANFAFCNRQVMGSSAQRVFEQVLAGRIKNYQLSLIYDLAHNIGKVEFHEINEQMRKVVVHRKGATRAFGPDHRALPEKYRSIGQPVLIPGSMGTASWVLTGTTAAMRKTLGSSCHGAGRVHSRKRARDLVKGDVLAQSLKQDGIEVLTGSYRGLAEEAPFAYKDVDEVVKSVAQVGIVDKVARLRPIAVIKG